MRAVTHARGNARRVLMKDDEQLKQEEVEKTVLKGVRKNRRKIRDGLNAKREDTNALLKMNVLSEISKEKGWTLEYTEMVCKAKEGEELYDPECALYYKMADMDIGLALQTQLGERKILKMLPEQERAIFIEKGLGKSCRQGFRQGMKQVFTGGGQQ